MANFENVNIGGREITGEEKVQILAAIFGKENLFAAAKPCPAAIALHAFALSTASEMMADKAAELKADVESYDLAEGSSMELAAMMASYNGHAQAAALLALFIGSIAEEHGNVPTPSPYDIVDWMHDQRSEWQCEAWRRHQPERAAVVDAREAEARETALAQEENDNIAKYGVPEPSDEEIAEQNVSNADNPATADAYAGIVPEAPGKRTRYGSSRVPGTGNGRFG